MIKLDCQNGVPQERRLTNKLHRGKCRVSFPAGRYFVFDNFGLEYDRLAVNRRN